MYGGVFLWWTVSISVGMSSFNELFSSSRFDSEMAAEEGEEQQQEGQEQQQTGREQAHQASTTAI